MENGDRGMGMSGMAVEERSRRMFVIDSEGSEDNNASRIRMDGRRKMKRRPIKSRGMEKTGTDGKRGDGGGGGG